DEPEHRLKKDLSALDLVVFGVGVIIGAGIFVLTGQAAAEWAGPAIALSFVIAAVACALAALCYAEFASSVPVAGSAYTFSYATLGELIAWTIGWDLALEFTVGSAALSTGFSGYLQEILAGTPLEIPAALSSAEDGVLNLPALLIALAVMTVLIVGIKLSSRINQVVVAIKVLVVLVVIAAGIAYIDGGNYTPFVPPAEAPAEGSGGFLDLPLIQSLFGLDPAVYGIGGVVTAAAIVFFAFIGFDVVATTAEETRNPQRSLPRGILGSLAIVTVLYVAVALVLTGMVRYTELQTQPDGTRATLATAFTSLGVDWAATVIAIGALAGLTTVVMVMLLGQIRVFFAMSRDGLLPRGFSHTGSHGTPVRATVLIGAVVAVAATFFPAGALEEMVNIGTLFAFVLVSIGVVVLRRTRPDLPRAFRTPLVPLVPILAVLACVWLMINLSVETWLRFVVWMLVGIVVYFAYGHSHSRLGQQERSRTE
ncbi:MAG TPA: amino acid permease, partial [Pseudonocardia sp.]|nr:amino acid permease [Pseudonocardia sp.]